MTALKATADAWNQIEKNSITAWEQVDSTTVTIPDTEFNRMLENATNKAYIKELLNNTKANRKAGYRTTI